MNIDNIIKWQRNSRMFKLIDKAKKSIIIGNSSIFSALYPCIKTAYSEYFFDDYKILSETTDSLVLINVYNESQIVIKKA